MSKSTRWAWVISLLTVTGVCGVLAFLLSIGATPRAGLLRAPLFLAVLAQCPGGGRAGDRHRRGGRAPDRAGAGGQVRQPAAAQAGRHLRAGRRGAGAADLHRVLPVREPQHRELVRRAPGQRAGGGSEPRPRHPGRAGGGPVQQDPRRGRAPVRVDRDAAGADAGAPARADRRPHRGPGRRQRPDPAVQRRRYQLADPRPPERRPCCARPAAAAWPASSRAWKTRPRHSRARPASAPWRCCPTPRCAWAAAASASAI